MPDERGSTSRKRKAPVPDSISAPKKPLKKKAKTSAGTLVKFNTDSYSSLISDSRQPCDTLCIFPCAQLFHLKESTSTPTTTTECDSRIIKRPYSTGEAFCFRLFHQKALAHTRWY
jgi:hypothetical protein